MTSTVNRPSNKQSKPTAEEILKQAQAQVKEGQKTAQEPLESCESEPQKKQEKPKPILAKDKTKAATGEAIQHLKETSKQAYLASIETGKQEGRAIADLERQGAHIGYLEAKTEYLIEDTSARSQELPKLREFIEEELAESEKLQAILDRGESKDNPLEALLTPVKSENSGNSFSLFLEG